MKIIFRISGLIVLLLLILILFSCKKDKPVLPTITTTSVTEISFTSAISGGNVTNDGGAPIDTAGVCWSTSVNPTIDCMRTVQDSGLVSFTSHITHLGPKLLYYLRAYATNSSGTGYGDQISFTTSGTVTDGDDNIYNIITIGSHTWITENLKTTKYNDSTPIALGIGNKISTPAYQWYNNNETTYKNTYGALYNWWAVNTGKLCPVGWHVPSEQDLTDLINRVGGEAGAGGLKETGTTHWLSPNYGATNEIGFTALPGGYDGGGIGMRGSWWSTKVYPGYGNPFHGIYQEPLVVVFSMYYNDEVVHRDAISMWHGFSVRCLLDYYIVFNKR